MAASRSSLSHGEDPAFLSLSAGTMVAARGPACRQPGAFSSELHQKRATQSLRKQALCPGSEALSGLAYVTLGTSSASPCSSDLGDTVPELGRRIPKEMLGKTENVFWGPSTSTEIPSPGSACEDPDHLSPYLPSSLLPGNGCVLSAPATLIRHCPHRGLCTVCS